MTAHECIAVLGAGGTMGLPMARNLARAGFDVRAWNRTRGKAEPLTEDGATVAETPARAAEGAGLILTILSDADAVLESMNGRDGALSRAGAGAVWLQMSTIGEEGTERCIDLAAEHDVRFVDAPVLGTKQPAEQGALVVMASGPEDLGERAQPVFEAVGRKTVWAGEAGQGTRLKLVVNSWLLSVVDATAESIALAQGLGVDPALFLDAVEDSAVDTPYLRMKGKAMLERSFEPSFRLALAAKDARLLEEAVQRRGLDLPLASLLRERFEAASAEHGEEDMSAIYWASAPVGTAT